MLYSDTLKRFGIFQYRYHHITVRCDKITDECLIYIEHYAFYSLQNPHPPQCTPFGTKSYICI